MADWKNTHARWGAMARLLHWLVALMIFILFGVGLIMGELPNGPDKFFVYAMHKSFGLLLLALVLVRVLWRVMDKAPADPAGSPVLQNKLAHLVHLGLYALMFTVPLTGWLVHSYAGYATHWFGQASLPLLPVLTSPIQNHDAVEQMGELHESIAWGLMLLVGLHIAAGLYHHIILKDDVMLRMSPRNRKSAK